MNTTSDTFPIFSMPSREVQILEAARSVIIEALRREPGLALQNAADCLGALIDIAKSPMPVSENRQSMEIV